MAAVQETVERVRSIDVEAYKYGFVSPIESEVAPQGLDEEIVRFISQKKAEPDWLLAWRLEAYRRWLTMETPTWARVEYPPIDFQSIHYFAAPKSAPAPKSLDEVDPELLRTYAKLGIPLVEQEVLAGVERPKVAVDAVFDSVSVATTFKAELAKAGVIFCSFSEAVRDHPDLVRRYLGSVVPPTDNFYATLNSAVFSDGSFAYVPPGVRCPMELSTYFRINERNTGQFERTSSSPTRAPTSAISRAARRPSATKTSFTLRWSNSWRSMMPRSNTRRCRIGIPETRKVVAASITSSPSAAIAAGRARKSLGPRSRPARRSPGNIPPAY